MTNARMNMFNRFILPYLCIAFLIFSCASDEQRNLNTSAIDVGIFKGVNSISHNNGSVVVLLDTGNHIDTSYFVLISSYIASMNNMDLSETNIIIMSPSDRGYLLNTNQCLNLVKRTKSKLDSNSQYIENAKYFLSNLSSKDCLQLHVLLMVISKDLYIDRYTSLLAILDGLSEENEEKASCAVISVAADLSRFPKFGIDSLLFQRMRADLCP
jgi:hypothetical protein